VDTNLIVSGIISPTGPPRRILTGWQRREFELVVSPVLLDEVARTLRQPRITRRYHVTAQDVTELGRLLTTRSILLIDVPPIPPAVRDPADDHILALARAGHADHIVSGDDDLLSLGRYAGIPILPPAAYVRLPEGR
jgi:uncharacterized protein